MAEQPISEAQAREALETQAKAVDAAKILAVIDNAGAIENLFKTTPVLEKHADEAGTMVALVKAHHKGEYSDIPEHLLNAIVAALLYVQLPNDLIPDEMPVLGMLDDSLVVNVCLAMVKGELEKFKAARAG